MKKISLTLISVFMAFVLSACGKSSLDPNRTKEPCSYLGEASVYGSAHTSTTTCTPDGDGYYNPAFGHHHHK